MIIREKIFRIIEAGDESTLSKVYDIFMILVIVASLLPLAFKEKFLAFTYIEYITTGIFIVDYIIRLITADKKIKKGWVSFLIYPFTPLAMIDAISVLPTFISAIGESFKVLKIIRLLRAFRVFKALKIIRYSKSIRIIVSVLKKQSRTLGTVVFFALGYILIAALVIFNIEPDTFENFFTAIYWATVSLTTVGYGDIYPVTTAGKIITMISSILGIAIIALPSGIITGGFLMELNKINDETEKQ